MSEHKRRFPKIKTVDNETAPAEDESAFMFDAVWTAALALNRTETRLQKENLTLTDFDYDDIHNISGMIYEEAINVNFLGLTVSHSLNCMLLMVHTVCIYVCTLSLKHNEIYPIFMSYT